MPISAGNFIMTVSDPLPCWVSLMRVNDERVFRFPHNELRDLQFVIERALAEAERKLPTNYKKELR